MQVNETKLLKRAMIESATAYTVSAALFSSNSLYTYLMCSIMPSSSSKLL